MIMAPVETSLPCRKPTGRRRRLPKQLECYVLYSDRVGKTNGKTSDKLKGEGREANGEGERRRGPLVDRKKHVLCSSSVTDRKLVNKKQRSDSTVQQITSSFTAEEYRTSAMPNEDTLQQKDSTINQVFGEINLTSGESVHNNCTTVNKAHQHQDRTLDSTYSFQESKSDPAGQDKYHDILVPSVDKSKHCNDTAVSQCTSTAYKHSSGNRHLSEKSQSEEQCHGVNRPSLKRSRPVRVGKSICEICGKIIKRFSQLQIHLRSHTGEKAFFCEICHRGFNVACNYRRHLLRHGKKKFECSHCKKGYFEKRHLDIHIFKVHSASQKTDEVQKASQFTKEVSDEDYKRFSCQHCNKRYSVKEGLIRHLQHNHIPCKECNKICRNPSEFKIHQLIHTSYRPFVCKICGKSFKCKMGIAHHVICHTDYMPYSCVVCEKRFRQAQGLWRHKKYHQTEKQHVCSLCSKAFCHKADLKRHSKIHESKTQPSRTQQDVGQPSVMLALSSVSQANTEDSLGYKNQVSASMESLNRTCKSVNENTNARTIAQAELLDGVSVKTCSTDVTPDLMIIKCSDSTKPKIDRSVVSSGAGPALQSVSGKMTDKPQELLQLSEQSLHDSGAQSRGGKITEIILASSQNERATVTTANSRIENYVLSQDGATTLVTAGMTQVTAGITQATAGMTGVTADITQVTTGVMQMTSGMTESSDILLESSPDAVISKDKAPCEMTTQGTADSDHLIYVIIQPPLDKLNSGDVSTNVILSNMERLKTAYVPQEVLTTVGKSEYINPMDDTSAETKLPNGSKCTAYKDRLLQYGHSLLTGKPVPLVQNSTAPDVTCSSVECMQNITFVSSDNLLLE